MRKSSQHFAPGIVIFPNNYKYLLHIIELSLQQKFIFSTPFAKVSFDSMKFIQHSESEFISHGIPISLCSTNQLMVFFGLGWAVNSQYESASGRRLQKASTLPDSRRQGMNNDTGDYLLVAWTLTMFSSLKPLVSPLSLCSYNK